MSLLNFIAGGLGAGGRPNQARTNTGILSRSALENGCKCIFNSSLGSPNLYSISTTTQTNNRSRHNFHIQYANHIRRNNTQDPTLYPVNSFFSNNTQDPILYSVNSFFSNHHNAFFRPPQNFRVYEQQNLLKNSQIYTII